jgi:hypothetical protein
MRVQSLQCAPSHRPRVARGKEVPMTQKDILG